MARWPAPYRCKKRLSKNVGPVRASYIQKSLTMHTVSVAKKLKETALISEFKIAMEGIGPSLAYKWAKSIGVKTISIQSAGVLGLKLRKELIKAQTNKRFILQKKARSTIVIGTDVPSLCEIDIINAIVALNQKELVIGPAYDGGYWLMGLSGSLVKPVTTLFFNGIKWGSSSVLEETLSKAKVQGIKYELLQYKNDLDNIKDLSPWYEI